MGDRQMESNRKIIVVGEDNKFYTATQTSGMPPVLDKNNTAENVPADIQDKNLVVIGIYNDGGRLDLKPVFIKRKGGTNGFVNLQNEDYDVNGVLPKDSIVILLDANNSIARTSNRYPGGIVNKEALDKAKINLDWLPDSLNCRP